MSATEELRRLLDERGVEWTYADGTVSFASNGRWYHAWAYSDDSMCVSMGYLTPEQAVSATLGQAERTCKLDYERHCSNCGVHVHESAVLVRKDLDGGAWTVVSKPANYCPNCGARIEVSDE